MTKETKQSLLDWAAYEVKHGTEGLASFKARLKDDPAGAFEWGADAVRSAARVEVGACLTRWLTAKDATVEAVLAEIERMVISAARWPENSTSPISNFTKVEVNAKWADFLARCKGV